AVGPRHVAGLVAHHGKWKAVFLPELAMALRRVARDAEHDDPRAREPVERVTERARLLGASRRTVLGVEIDDSELAFLVGELDGLTSRVVSNDIGCRRS